MLKQLPRRPIHSSSTTPTTLHSSRRVLSRLAAMISAVVVTAGVAACDAEESLLSPAALEANFHHAEDGAPTSSRTVTVTPESVTVTVGSTTTLTAVERWPSGSVNHSAEFVWRTSDRSVARVDSDGQVTALAPGSTEISAARAGRSGSAVVVVTSGTDEDEETGVTLRLSPSTSSLNPTQSIQIQATVTDARGEELGAGDLVWTSSNRSVVQVVGNGDGAVATAMSDGSAHVTATLGEAEATTKLTVAMDAPRSMGTIPAFPGAEGYGAAAFSTCNRQNPHVFAVTNLNDSGAGSFRQAMANAEAAPSGDLKVITFREGGYIRTRSRIIFGGNCLYVAGQTAPGDGVTLRGRGLEFHRDARDIVIRYLRIRLGTGASDDGILIRRGENYVLDHLSISWTDRTLLRFSRTQIGRSGPIRNVTIQRSLLGESLAASPTAVQIGGEGDTDRDGAGWRDVTHFSLHGNALVSNNHRNINARGIYIESVNNVVHNWNLDGGQTGRGAVVDWINNYIQKGPMSRGTYVPFGVGTAHVTGSPHYEPSIHLSGNVSLGGSEHDDQSTRTSADNWKGSTNLIDWYHSGSGGDLSRFRRSSPIRGLTGSPIFPVNVRDAYSARDRVLQSVGADRGLDCRGAWMHRQDRVDQRLIQDISSGGGWSSGRGPSSESNVGGFPGLSSGSACSDSSGNGIPDQWLRDRGIPVDDPSVAGRIGSGGYSYLEHYLNGTRP